MKGKTAGITLSAAFAAFAVVFLYISSVFPAGKMGFVAAASLFVAAAVVETGIKGGVMVYAVSSVLGFLLVPAKESVLIYAVFFGYYPIVKSVAEKRKNRVYEWIIKLSVVNAALSVLFFAFKEMFLSVSGLTYAVPVMYAIINAAFVLFDIGTSGVIAFYDERVHKKVRR